MLKSAQFEVHWGLLTASQYVRQWGLLLPGPMTKQLEVHLPSPFPVQYVKQLGLPPLQLVVHAGPVPVQPAQLQ